ncbi:MAG TPA: dihydropyrimidinase [Clostridia bacterium]|nr:dihydropyrimidinase [Clostridia bacterium]
MKTLIAHGTVVNFDGEKRADVLVEDGLVARVGPDLRADGAHVVDARGCSVLPGFIDTHTHFDLDLGFTRTADDFTTGTKAAVLGGTTTVLDFATQEPEGTLAAALEAWHEKAKGSSCNYGFHMAIARWDQATEAELPAMTDAGVTSYKMYMVYDKLRVDDGSIYAALKAISREGALLGVHCENWDVLQRMIREVKTQEITGPEGHPLSRPAPVEAEAVARLMRIAELAKAPVYVVHLSTKEGLAEALRARARGQEVYLETCPQYLLLTDERYAQSDGAKFVMSPPLRKAEDCAALWRGLAEGEIDFVGTDHCSFTMAQKARGRDDFSLTPNGSAGVQHRGELLYTYGACAGKITLPRMVELLSYAPSRLFGMEGRGLVAEGYAADLVVWDPEASYRIEDAKTAHNCDNSPYAGFAVEGRARDVFVNGMHVVSNFALVRPGMGKYISRKGYIHTR